MQTETADLKNVSRPFDMINMENKWKSLLSQDVMQRSVTRSTTGIRIR